MRRLVRERYEELRRSVPEADWTTGCISRLRHPARGGTVLSKSHHRENKLDTMLPILLGKRQPQ
jgi:hypothetical protein